MLNYAYYYRLKSEDGKTNDSGSYITNANTTDQARIELEKKYGDRLEIVEPKDKKSCASD